MFPLEVVNRGTQNPTPGIGGGLVANRQAGTARPGCSGHHLGGVEETDVSVGVQDGERVHLIGERLRRVADGAVLIAGMAEAGGGADLRHTGQHWKSRGRSDGFGWSISLGVAAGKTAEAVIPIHLSRHPAKIPKEKPCRMSQTTYTITHINWPQKHFSLNRGASRKQIPIRYYGQNTKTI